MPRKRNLTNEQDSYISELYLSGMTHREISEYLKIKIHNIESSLKRTKTPSRKRGYKSDNEVDFRYKKEIIKDYYEMKSLSKLSQKYGSLTQLRSFLKNEGLLQNKNNKIEIDDSKVLSLYNEGLTFEEITDKTGYSQWCIGQSLKRQEIDTSKRRKTEKELFKIYVNSVRRYTLISWKNHHEKINPNNYKRSRTDFHIDHIYSVFEGFKNNIPPFIIGHWTNLQMLPYDKNIKKLIRCGKTKENLINDFYSF